jgi:hypothetical protein
LNWNEARCEVDPDADQLAPIARSSGCALPDWPLLHRRVALVRSVMVGIESAMT